MKDWVKLVNEWRYIRELESIDLKDNFREVLIEIVSAVFGKSKQNEQ